MSDLKSGPGGDVTLRDRIAAVVDSRIRFWRKEQGYIVDGIDGMDVADAVIGELDLGIPCATTGCRMRQIARRLAKLSSQLTDDDYDEQYDHPDYTPSWVRRSNDE